MSPRTLARRYAWLLRLMAVCLLLLTASPFTAPFATCDLADVVLHTAVDEGSDLLGGKTTGDTALLPCSTLLEVDQLAFLDLIADRARSLVMGAGQALFPLRL